MSDPTEPTENNILESVVNNTNLYDLRSSSDMFIGDSYVSNRGKSNSQFQSTVRDRPFVDSDDPDNSYFGKLFGMATLSSEELDSLNERLNDQNIVLLGGGTSRISQQLNQIGVNPKQVLNVDPFVETDIEVGTKDKVLSVSAATSDLPELVSQVLEGDVSEIWCLYSVPYYLETTEIISFFQNIRDLSTPGTVTRIFPIDLIGVTDDQQKEENEYKLKERKDSIRANVNQFIKDTNFKVFRNKDGLLVIVHI